MVTKHFCKIEKVIDAQIEEVWEAFTDPNIFKTWFFGTDLMCDWEVGSPIIFSGTYEGSSYRDKGTVLEIEPLESIIYSYLSQFAGLEDEPENYLKVSYQFEAVKDGTKVVINQSNYSAAKAIETEKGWKMLLEALKSILESRIEI